MKIIQSLSSWDWTRLKKDTIYRIEDIAKNSHKYTEQGLLDQIENEINKFMRRLPNGYYADY